MSATRSVFMGDDDRASGRADEGLIEGLLLRWAEEARLSGREEDALALEGRADLASDLEHAAENDLLAAFRRDVEREFALVLLHAESQGDDIYRGPTR